MKKKLIKSLFVTLSLVIGTNSAWAVDETYDFTKIAQSITASLYIIENGSSGVTVNSNNLNRWADFTNNNYTTSRYTTSEFTANNRFAGNSTFQLIRMSTPANDMVRCAKSTGYFSILNLNVGDKITFTTLATNSTGDIVDAAGITFLSTNVKADGTSENVAVGDVVASGTTYAVTESSQNHLDLKVAIRNGFMKIVITPNSTITKTISTAGYATFSSIHHVTVPSDVSVYKAAVNATGDKIALTQVNTDIIPANTGVILYSSVPGDKNLIITETASTGDFTGNQLIASSLTPTIPATGTYYALKANSNEFAIINGGVILSANKAYIQATSGSASILIDNITTGINSISTTEKAGRDFYSMQGLKVSKPSKGIYIQNGKKIIIK